MDKRVSKRRPDCIVHPPFHEWATNLVFTTHNTINFASEQQEDHIHWYGGVASSGSTISTAPDIHELPGDPTETVAGDVVTDYDSIIKKFWGS